MKRGELNDYAISKNTNNNIKTLISEIRRKNMISKTITMDKTTPHKKKVIKKTFRTLETELTDKTDKKILKAAKKCLLALTEFF